MHVPFVNLSREANLFFPDLIKSTEKVLKSGIYINGPNVKAFEKFASEYFQVKHAVSTGNGSDALTFILRCLNIKKDDEIIIPANSFIATAWAVIAAGAKPVFCDVDSDMLLDKLDFEKKITPKTVAVIPVHLTGRVFEISNINKTCENFNIKIIEDAAQSFGAYDKNKKKTGNLGLAGAFSLHPLKNLSIYGDGGLITTNDKEIAEKCKLLRNHGLKDRDNATLWGYNSRLDELQAAYAIIKLSKIEEISEKYAEIATFYNDNLSSLFTKPEIRTNYRDVYHNYVIRVSPQERDSIRDFMSKNGVGTAIHYPIPLHLQECSKHLNFKKGDIPNVEYFAKSMISLPIYPTLEQEEINYIVNTANTAIERLN